MVLELGQYIHRLVCEKYADVKDININEYDATVIIWFVIAGYDITIDIGDDMIVVMRCKFAVYHDPSNIRQELEYADPDLLQKLLDII